jgi:hypothetical protein
VRGVPIPAAIGVEYTLVGCDNKECPASDISCFAERWNTRVSSDSSVVNDARQLYRALENLYGDLYLVGLAEISLESVYEGSARDAIKVLKRLQRWRQKDVRLAIGQAAEKLDAPERETETTTIRQS